MAPKKTYDLKEPAKFKATDKGGAAYFEYIKRVLAVGYARTDLIHYSPFCCQFANRRIINRRILPIIGRRMDPQSSSLVMAPRGLRLLFRMVYGNLVALWKCWIG